MHISYPLSQNGNKRMNVAQVKGLVFGETQESNPGGGLTLEPMKLHAMPQYLSDKRVQSPYFI